MSLTASVLAGELGIPLFQVRFDALTTKFMDETAAKLRQTFDAMVDIRGVYFLMNSTRTGPSADWLTTWALPSDFCSRNT
ncbi:hypothetical protein ABFY47_25630 [Enterobacter ludwigii]|uniref:hypothetical protein n=1 Tax=Enterobacter ludwigii TaxID=299767 RepID=UPI003D1D31A0